MASKIPVAIGGKVTVCGPSNKPVEVATGPEPKFDSFSFAPSSKAKAMSPPCSTKTKSIGPGVTSDGIEADEATCVGGAGGQDSAV